MAINMSIHCYKCYYWRKHDSDSPGFDFSFRAQFSQSEDSINPLHGSDTVESANTELEFFFPMQKTVAVIKPDAYENKGTPRIVIIIIIRIIIYLYCPYQTS